MQPVHWLQTETLNKKLCLHSSNTNILQYVRAYLHIMYVCMPHRKDYANKKRIISVCEKNRYMYKANRHYAIYLMTVDFMEGQKP